MSNPQTNFFQPVRRSSNGAVINPYKSNGRSAASIHCNNSGTFSRLTTTTASTTVPTVTITGSNMPRSRNPLRASTTNNAHQRAINVYEDFAKVRKHPSYLALKPPTDTAGHCRFKALLNGYSDYIVLEVTQVKKPTEKLSGTSGKQMFISFMGALCLRPDWACFKKPDWYTGMGYDIEKRLTVDKASEGDTGNTIQGAKSNVKRPLFKRTIMTVLKKAAPKDQGLTWSKW